ncbi:hypothetical protein B0H11DRAFT_2331565 [Mycena galericulata]|nr:hypothetical protein B0H11DRAFT_2331565 [Mycena galericulata]
MKFSIAITSLLASVVSAASLQARQYNDGQLLSPAAGATVSSGSQVTIKYRVYDSIDAGTRYILVGFENSPDEGDHYTYPVGNLSLSSPGSSGLTINSPVTAPGIGSYKLVIYDVRTAGAAQTLYSQMTVNQTITELRWKFEMVKFPNNQIVITEFALQAPPGGQADQCVFLSHLLPPPSPLHSFRFSLLPSPSYPNHDPVLMPSHSQSRILQTGHPFLDSSSFVEMYFPFVATSPSLFTANDAAGAQFAGTGSTLYDDDGSVSAVGALLLQ